MGILLPNDVDWSPANWVGRGLFEDLLERGSLPPALAADTQFCVDAEVDTLDLRDASTDDLRVLRRAVGAVVRSSEAQGSASFQRPEFHSVYLEKLRSLEEQLEGLLGAAAEAADGADHAAPLGDFPVGETLDDGAYRITANLFGSGVDRVHLAARVDEPGARFLVSSTSRRTASPGELHRLLAYASPGVFDLEYIGPFDARGEDAAARSLRTEHTAIVERLPAGAPVRMVVTGALPVPVAATIGIAIGRILQSAAEAGRFLVAVRPETIWAEREQDIIRVTGLTVRGDQLFRVSRGICYTTAPTYERRYTAPELVRGEPQSDRTLTFVLATMLAEWMTGSHPFPDAWTLRDAVSVASGRHAPLEIPPPLGSLIDRALRVDPAERPALAEVIATLESVGPGPARRGSDTD